MSLKNWSILWDPWWTTTEMKLHPGNMWWNLKSRVHNNKHVRLVFDWRAAVLRLGPKRRFRKKIPCCGSCSTTTQKINTPKVLGSETQRRGRGFILPRVILRASEMANTAFRRELTALSQSTVSRESDLSISGRRPAKSESQTTSILSQQ